FDLIAGSAQFTVCRAAVDGVPYVDAGGPIGGLDGFLLGGLVAGDEQSGRFEIAAGFRGCVLGGWAGIRFLGATGRRSYVGITGLQWCGFLRSQRWLWGFTR